MSWNHRVVKETHLWIVGDETITEDEYSIREAYYNRDGGIYAVTDNPVSVTAGEGVDELKETLRLMLEATEQPIIDLNTFEFQSHAPV